jgi:hypothetical protein
MDLVLTDLGKESNQLVSKSYFWKYNPSIIESESQWEVRALYLEEVSRIGKTGCPNEVSGLDWDSTCVDSDPFYSDNICGRNHIFPHVPIRLPNASRALSFRFGRVCMSLFIP